MPGLRRSRARGPHTLTAAILTPTFLTARPACASGSAWAAGPAIGPRRSTRSGTPPCAGRRSSTAPSSLFISSTPPSLSIYFLLPSSSFFFSFSSSSYRPSSHRVVHPLLLPVRLCFPGNAQILLNRSGKRPAASVPLLSRRRVAPGTPVVRRPCLSCPSLSRCCICFCAVTVSLILCFFSFSLFRLCFCAGWSLWCVLRFCDRGLLRVSLGRLRRRRHLVSVAVAVRVWPARHGGPVLYLLRPHADLYPPASGASRRVAVTGRLPAARPAPATPTPSGPTPP